MKEPNEAIRRAEEELARAATELDRQQLVAKLCEREGLAYASMTRDQLSPMLVTYQHRPIGEISTESPSPLHDWFARLYQADGSLGEPSGPHVTARAAAASLIHE